MRRGRPDTDGTVPPRYEVVVSAHALNDIDSIYSYIAATHPLNAGRYVERIGDAIAALALLPRAWPRLPGERMELRSRVIGSHRVVFRVRPRTLHVRVLRVLDARSTIASAVRAALRANQ